MKELRPNAQRAKAAVMLIYIMLILDIALLVSGYFLYELIQIKLNGGTVSADAAHASIIRERILTILHLSIFIISAVTFIRWFRRAYYNLHLRVNFLSQTEGWAAGSWFVPVLNFFRPYQIMKELYIETKKYISGKGVAVNEKFSEEYLSIWWALWVINTLVSQFVFRYSMRAVTMEQLSIATKFGMISNLIGIPLALITIKVIRDYAAVEPFFAGIQAEAINHEEESTINHNREEGLNNGSSNV